MRLLVGEEQWRPGVEGVGGWGVEGSPASWERLERGEEGEGSGLRRWG